MRTGVIAAPIFALAGLACLASALATAASYQYTTFGITLNPPGDVTVTGLDAAGDVDGYIYRGTGKASQFYAFAYVNGSIELATPIGGKFYSLRKG